jgi:hypothetical protein
VPEYRPVCYRLLLCRGPIFLEWRAIVDSTELAFFTNDELIAELMRRKTFLGVVVQSESDWKQDQWGEERTFRVHFNKNLVTEEASRLLGRVASYMDCHH